jgi:hypothetical protein
VGFVKSSRLSADGDLARFSALLSWPREGCLTGRDSDAVRARVEALLAS